MPSRMNRQRVTTSESENCKQNITENSANSKTKMEAYKRSIGQSLEEILYGDDS